ncbi:MAG: 3-mercaptopyruvate sulfurtransferase [Pseudomonadota bacterium]|nr:3-mercaptopyruvate sulfurtransferase [Pseudomonadota bacterium]
MEYANPDALVETDWLSQRLDDPSIRIVDATWFMPNVDRSAKDEVATRHIPGAVYWDIDAIADPTDPLPHMVPGATEFAHFMANLMISDNTRVVAYDRTGMSNAPRAWWTLRYFGHDNVSVLNGGLNKWMAEDRPTDTSGPQASSGQYTATVQPPLIRSREEIINNLKTGEEQVLDARAAGRFAGTEPEPREGMRSGHIPGSLNLPFGNLIDPESGLFLDSEGLSASFADAGIDMDRPVITSCGSGVTACVLALGLHLLGNDSVAVYDGSWTEWGGRDDTPIEV